MARTLTHIGRGHLHHPRGDLLAGGGDHDLADRRTGRIACGRFGAVNHAEGARAAQRGEENAMLAHERPRFFRWVFIAWRRGPQTA